MEDLSELFAAYQAGDREVVDRLFALLYPDLMRMARARLRAGRRLTLVDTSALVHELYLRLVRTGRIRVENRAHFMAYTARVMRSIVVDFARQHRAARRGGDLARVTLNTSIGDGEEYPEERVMEIADAVDALAKIDQRLATVVEMQFFAGFTAAEIAKVLGVNERTVRRDFEKARLLLSVELQ
jgi:RNA polymerase sigma factor (TIGR02999 family)